LIFISVQKYQVDLLVIFSFNVVPIFKKIMQFGLIFVKFLELHQDFFIKIEVVNNDDFLCWCKWHNLIINFDKNSFLPSKNLTKMIKLHQFLKTQDQFEVKILED